MKTMSVFAVLVLLVSPAAAESYAYISLAGQNQIAIYKMDAEEGDLTRHGLAAISGSPGAICVDPKRRFLFASIRSAGDLSSFRIDPDSGRLSLISTIPAGADPAYVATDRTGRYLLSAYYRAGKAAVHPIGDDGSLSSQGGKWYPTAEKAHAILTDRTNRFAFVPHTGPNAIFQFKFNEKTGELVANLTPKVLTGQGTGPRHLSFHPTKHIVYADNEQGSSLTAYRLDKSTGRLSPFQTISTLPDDFEGPNSCAHLELSPRGQFAYVSNRGHDSIACFAIDAVSGRLTSIGHAPTEKTPRSFNIDPTGTFLLAAGESSDKLASYRIDAKTGRLTGLRTYNVGKQPWWVLVVNMPE